ncbi:hypothetical protein [Sphingomonas sp.]|uniref:hypothetical protein n=1 Tax=Sphingomonas sp. TaxID=28214 RepID=UPI002ED8E81E
MAIALAAPAIAQDTYQPGQAIQYSDGSGWTDAEFLRLTPDGTQAIVREKNAFSTDGFFQRAVSLNRLRRAGGQPATAPAAQAAPRPAAQAPMPAVRPPTPLAQTSGAPRSGDYNVYSYGRPSNPIRLGRINLSGGQYRFYNNGDQLLGQGQYGFAAGTVTWRTGLLKGYGWGGAFKIDGGGREHVIRLNQVTVAMNSR